jgi:hypothetical protein
VSGGVASAQPPANVSHPSGVMGGGVMGEQGFARFVANVRS